MLNMIIPSSSEDSLNQCEHDYGNRLDDQQQLTAKRHNKALSRPKLHTIHSSDTSRFPTLERLENSMMLPKSSKITVEPVMFPGDFTTNNMTKGYGSQSDVKSIHSVASNHKNRKRQYFKRKKNHLSTPTEIFAKNLSEAVLDVDDSCEDGYVYNTKGGGLYPSLSPPITVEVNSNNENNSYFSNHRKQKFRRPGLRSTVSELPARGVKSLYLESMSFSKFEKRKFQSSHFRCSSSSSSNEEDEENTPLLYYSSSSSHRRRRQSYNKRRKRGRVTSSIFSMSVCCCWLVITSLLCTILCLSLALMSTPLKDVEAVTFGNVLATQKQLIFDLHVRASNANAWKVQMSRSAISLFAASHYVPTVLAQNATMKEEDNSYENSKASTRQEYLGTINSLEDPLVFEAPSLFYFGSKTTLSTSQVQIKNPGETNGDTSGNERWSLIIRYPFELTLRGVLKYQVFPYISTKTYTARVCKVMQIDPATGIIEEVPRPEQSICDEV